MVRANTSRHEVRCQFERQPGRVRHGERLQRGVIITGKSLTISGENRESERAEVWRPSDCL